MIHTVVAQGQSGEQELTGCVSGNGNGLFSIVRGAVGKINQYLLSFFYLWGHVFSIYWFIHTYVCIHIIRAHTHMYTHADTHICISFNSFPQLHKKGCFLQRPGQEKGSERKGRNGKEAVFAECPLCARHCGGALWVLPCRSSPPFRFAVRTWKHREYNLSMAIKLVTDESEILTLACLNSQP